LTDASGGATGSLISESGLEPVVSAIFGVWRRGKETLQDF